jgi:hypothetical protein
LPINISAIQLFLKNEPATLFLIVPPSIIISKKKLNLKDNVIIESLEDMPTCYVISGQSPHFEKRQAAFNDYASKN